MSTEATPETAIHALAQWYLEWGVDLSMDDQAVNWYAAAEAARDRMIANRPRGTEAPADIAGRTAAAAPPAGQGSAGKGSAGQRGQAGKGPAAPGPAVLLRADPAAVDPMSPQAVAASARSHAAAARTLAELEAALHGFEGCALKATASHTVFADGNPEADLMLVGEAPGAEEDRRGLPFVGASGQLLDRMLAAIGRDRGQVYITNVLPWRPPGNRTPSPAEIAACLPFALRHIALVRPRLVVAVGGVSAKALLDRPEGITRLRGRSTELMIDGLDQPVPVFATFHPAYLLRQPAQKRLAWTDWLHIAERLEKLPETGR
ncbi:uracil-DNA glycosylase [Tistrella arctica]